MTRRHAGVAAFLSAWILGATPALAQAPLTIQEAVKAALATSGSIESARAKELGAQARLDEANTRTLPTVSVGITPIHLGLLNPAIAGLLNQFAPGMSPDILSETLTVSQVLYEGGRTSLGKQAAGVGQEMAAQGVRISRQNAAFETANGFLNVLRAESLYDVVLLNQRQAQEHLKDAQLREKTGAAARFDTLQAETALANVNVRMIQARNAVRLARLALATAIHQPLGDRRLDPLPALPGVAVDEAGIVRGLDQRPEIEVSRRQAAIDRLTTEITARDRLPIAAVQGIVAAQGLSVPAYIVMGSLSWTMFDGGKTETQIRQGEASVAADEANLTALREGLRLEVEKAIADRDEARERIIVSEQGLKTAQAGFDLATLRYSEGAGTGTEVIDAAGALSLAHSAYTQATYDLSGSELRLAKALGIDMAGLLGA